MRWLRRIHPGRGPRAVPLAELMEPRLLFSADLAGGLLLGTDAAATAAEIRILDAGGEYADTSSAASVPAGTELAVPAASGTVQPLSFQANEGQAPPAVDFVARGGGYDIALDDGNALLTFDTIAGRRSLELSLVGNAMPSPAEGEGLPIPETGGYGAVVYRGVYEGIDLRYHGKQQQLEYDFIVAPGADPGDIALRFIGAESVAIAPNGDLVLRVAGAEGEVRFHAPVSYQRGADGIEAVASRYEIRPDGTVGFVVGAYDSSRELVIDPILNVAAVVLPATPEDTPVTITSAQLIGGAINPSGTLGVSTLTASSGTLVDNGDGTWTFTPAANDDSSVTFDYSLTGGLDVVATTATMDLTPVNDPPVGNADSFTTPEDTLLVINLSTLLSNDSDPEGSALSLVSVANGTGGTATLNGNGTVSFKPADNFNGSATFTYVVSDGVAQSTATVTIDVTPVNDAPVANDDSGTTYQDTAVTFTAAQLLGNDTDVEGHALTIVSVSAGAVLNPDGSVTFTPTAGFQGTTSFNYRVSDGTSNSNNGKVTVTVLPPNHAPVAVADTLAATEDTPVTYAASALTANDTDVEGTPLQIAAVHSGAGGTAVLNPDGTLTFTPVANFSGAATFTYTVNDGNANSAPVTVTVNVLPQNDAPTTAHVTLPPLAEDVTRVITQADLLAMAGDVDGDTLTASNLTASTGTLVDNGDGTWSFTPDADFNGTVDFTYGITDGAATVAATASLAVTAVNDAPVTAPVTLTPMAEDSGIVTITSAQLLARAGDVDGPALTVSNLVASTGTLADNGDGTWSFTPRADFNGTVTFTYQVGDGAAAVAGTASLGVTPVDDAPVAAADNLGAVEDEPANYKAADLLANDTDAEDAPLSISGVGNAVGGKVVLNADGSITFTPDADFVGTASFTYTVTDGALGSSPATVSVSVSPVNDAPVIDRARWSPTLYVDVPENGSAVTTLRASDVDTPQQGLVYSIAGGADAGRFVIDPATGVLSFAAAPDFEAPGDADADNVYEVMLQVSDGALAATQSLVVRVLDASEPLPPPPVAASPEPPALPLPLPVPSAPAPAPATTPVVPGLAGTPAAAPASPAGAGRTTTSLSDALGVTTENPLAALHASDLSFDPAGVRTGVDTASIRVLHTVVLDRAGLELISAQGSTELSLARFGIDSRADAARLEEFQRSLRSSAFTTELDRLRESVREDLDLEQAATISVVSVSLGLSVVYVLWLIRGGVLLGSYLSALPAWRLLDPLPVLSRMGDDEEDEDAPLDVEDSDGRHTLRGFG